jgi:hypothetical protein
LAAEAQIKAVITADDRASATLDKFGGGLGNVSKLGAVAAASIAALGVATVAFGVASTKAFMESELAIAQTNAVLKSTGGAAGVTADMVDKLSSSIEKNTRYSDEQVRSAQNMLLTFTNIGKDVFPDATRAVADMATAMGTDLKQTSIQVGKALQDPVLGVTALQRVGVRLSESQKDLVKSLVATGDTAGAQRVIIAELTKEFGGSAEAAGNTFAGSLDKLNNQFNNLMESIGGGIAQYLQPFVANALLLVQQWQDGSNPALENIKNKVGEVLAVFGRIWSFLVTTFKPVLDQLVAAFVEYVVPALHLLWAEVQFNLMPALKEFWAQNKDWLIPTLQALAVIIGGLLIGAILFLIAVMRALIIIVSSVITAFIDFRRWVENTSYSVVGWFYDMKRGIEQAVSGLYDTITKPYRDAFNWIKNAAGSVKDTVSGALDPNKRHSPSLVDKITIGTTDIKKQYTGLFDDMQGLGTGFKVSDLVATPQPTSQAPATITKQQDTAINISLSGIFTGTPGEARKLAEMVASNLKTIANSRNITVAEMMGA